MIGNTSTVSLFFSLDLLLRGGKGGTHGLTLVTVAKLLVMALAAFVTDFFIIFTSISNGMNLERVRKGEGV